MFEKLTELIAAGDVKEALYELQEEYVHIGEMTPKEAAGLCILEATLWEQLGDGEAELRAIEKGLNNDAGNYELFYMLGVYYQNINVNKSFLSYEMSLHYCDNDEDRPAIEEQLEIIRQNPAMRVRKVSIMILSYEDFDVLKECIDALERHMPKGSFEIVVVDNASSDPAVLEFLREKKDSAEYPFKLLENDYNAGFPAGCNMGADMADRDSDIFFLNNDAVVTSNAVYWLRMGLYEDRNTGAAGAMSNSASNQEYDPEFYEAVAGEKLERGWHKRLGLKRSIEILEEAAARNNYVAENHLIRRFKLIGFAVLISRDAINAVAPDLKIFDERFTPGYFEDDDLGIRIALAGFDQYLCTNAFVYHNGGSGFEGHPDAMERGREKFIDKWGFDSWQYYAAWDEVLTHVARYYTEKGKRLRILDLACGFGATAAQIKYLLPGSFVAGVCKNSFAAAIAGRMTDEVTWGDPNLCTLPWPDNSFDIVIAEKAVTSSGRVFQCIVPGGLYINEEGVTVL